MQPAIAGASRLPLRVLVVDDDRNIRVTLGVCLEGMGCEVRQAASGDAALSALAERSFDLAFLDLRLGTASGLELLPRLLAECPQLSVVVVTAYATVDTAVEAVKRGAEDYLPKPFTPEQIRHVVAKVTAARATRSRVAALEAQVRESVAEIDLATESPAMRGVYDTIERAAHSDAPVLLRGESGTGKGVVARALHAQSPRRERPFAVVSCPTLTGDLLASELFGHVRGAFTGAVRDQPGRVEAAEGGTLFLDEIAEIAPALQAKLLRFLQDHEFERVGEARTRRADVRVVAATHRDLAADVAAGRFREDLYYRLAVVEVVVPPLRERPDDVVRLARRFLGFFCRAAGRREQTLSPACERVLRDYGWPGNVRELRNAMERCTILWPADVVEPEALPERILGAAPSAPRLGGDVSLDALEQEHIRRVLARAATLEEAARILGIDDSTLWRKRKRYGL
ncbi:MAG: sigma-54-dependent Fis family transcriptional regulator [Proteobacteria bacterium]|nr:MAG: sigma-54-dependent Fis family transcriptional regulator [Pseudomonadota bacterium]